MRRHRLESSQRHAAAWTGGKGGGRRTAGQLGVVGQRGREGLEQRGREPVVVRRACSLQVGVTACFKAAEAPGGSAWPISTAAIVACSPVGRVATCLRAAGYGRTRRARGASGQGAGASRGPPSLQGAEAVASRVGSSEEAARCGPAGCGTVDSGRPPGSKQESEEGRACAWHACPARRQPAVGTSAWRRSRREAGSSPRSQLGPPVRAASRAVGHRDERERRARRASNRACRGATSFLATEGLCRFVNRS